MFSCTVCAQLQYCSKVWSHSSKGHLNLGDLSDVIPFPFCSGFEQQVFLGWTPFQCVHQVHGLSVKQVAHPHLKLLLLDTPLVVGAVLLQDQLQFKEEKRIKVTDIAVRRSRGLLLQNYWSDQERIWLEKGCG